MSRSVRTNLAACVLGLGVPCALAALPADTLVIMRGGERAPQGIVAGADAAGVTVDLAGTEKPERIVLSWDRVAGVEGVEGADAFTGIAETAWRARSRLSRGDAAGAEPLFESLFTKYEGQHGATAGVVASGLLRCRLSRQAQSAAVRAWLALVASGEKETAFDTPVLVADGIVVPAMVDAETGLAPGLPPIWIPSPAVEAMIATAPRKGGALPDDAPATRSTLLDDLYRASASATMGRAVKLPELPEGDRGAALVWDVVAATAGTKDERAAARGRLSARLADEQSPPPQWEEAWCRVALGRSQMLDGNEEERLRGMVNLLHVPARLEHVSPYLAGVALVDVARALDRAGHVDDAARVWRELGERYPGHPALGLRGVHDGAAPTAAGGGK